MNVFAETRVLLETQGFAPLAVDNARSNDPITLHSALRRTCGLEPTAWLPAYNNWEKSTATYSKAYTFLSELAAQRNGSRIDLSVWAGRAGEHEVFDLLDAAAAAKPTMSIGAPPQLRRGCRASVSGTLSISGVLIAAIKQLMEQQPTLSIGAIIGRAAEQANADLRTVSNEDFLQCLLDFDATIGEGIGEPKLSADASAAIQELQKAAYKRTDYRLSRLVAALATIADKPVVLLTDEELGSLCKQAAHPKTGATFLRVGGVSPGEVGSAGSGVPDDELVS